MHPTLVTAHRRFAAQPGSGLILDVAIAAGVLTGCLILLSDGRSPGLRPGAHVGTLVIGS